MYTYYRLPEHIQTVDDTLIGVFYLTHFIDLCFGFCYTNLMVDNRPFLKDNNVNGLPFYRTWANMKRRCFNKKHPDWSRYGGRGITVCKEWLKYENFEKEMYEEYGYFLEEHGQEKVRSMFTLDRIDNNSGYSKENCRWITIKEQQQNRRAAKTSILFNGKSLMKNAREKGIKYGTLTSRIKSGWSLEKAINTPVKAR